jgi:hypothetical protein
MRAIRRRVPHAFKVVEQRCEECPAAYLLVAPYRIAKPCGVQGDRADHSWRVARDVDSIPRWSMLNGTPSTLSSELTLDDLKPIRRQAVPCS